MFCIFNAPSPHEIYTLSLHDALPISKFSQIVDDINAGKGNVGKFLKDEQLYNNINQTTAGIRDLMNDINAGKGTLGRSEERRVGKECRSRWSPEYEKQNKKEKETRRS